MAYTKTTWVNNQAPAINAENLNKIEDGIYNSVRYADAQALTDEQKTQARANIAAAPDGFGLGTISQVVTDFDTVKLNGWYWGAAGTAHAPDSENNWSVRVTNLSHSNDLCIQDAYALINVNRYLHCRRMVYVDTATQNNPWEWVDPPMYAGVEYRTTERYLSKPVYCKLVDFGALPNKTSKDVIIASDISAAASVDVIGTAGALLTNYDGIINVSCSPGAIRIATSVDMSDTSVYCLCKYTKTTD